jgi:MurNAc alpha-1-phosphate uridylyltransferase
MNYKPRTAFILAAGEGTRLRPYTDSMPKPMVSVGGKSIIQRNIEKLATEGVEHIVINLCYLADILEEHLKKISAPRLSFSREETLMNTGGGIKKALPLLGEEPFYILSGDALWEDGVKTALSNLADSWKPEKMDLLLMMQPQNKIPVGDFVGDYDLEESGQIYRSKEKKGGFMFNSLRIAHPRIFENTPNGAFSFLELMDKAEWQNRLYGIVHDADWYHISTPKDLEEANGLFHCKID